MCDTWTQQRNDTIKFFLIVGNLGLVNLWGHLKPLADSPAICYAMNDGIPVKLSNTFCIFENHVENIMWCHTELGITVKFVTYN